MRLFCSMLACLWVTMFLPRLATGQNSELAVQEIRELLQKEKVNDILFPNGSFDPSSFDPDKFDPLMLEATWERVRGSVVELLKRNLGIELSKDPLKLYVGDLSGTQAERPGSDTLRPRRCRIIFLETRDSVRDVLMRSFSLPRECFPLGWNKVPSVTLLPASQLTLAWADLAQTTVEFVNSAPEIKRLGFAPLEPVELDYKVQVVTGWRKYGRYGGFDMFWRLFFQVKKESARGTFVVTVRGQVARNLPGGETSHIEYLGSDEFDSRFEVRLGEMRQGFVSNFVWNRSVAGPDQMEPGPFPMEPTEASTSAQLAQNLLDAYVKRLTR
jgi:hypothetical protein